jgi:hypothetical protein
VVLRVKNQKIKNIDLRPDQKEFWVWGQKNQPKEFWLGQGSGPQREELNTEAKTRTANLRAKSGEREIVDAVQARERREAREA